MYEIRNAREYYPDFHNVVDNLFQTPISENISNLTQLIINNKALIGYIDKVPLARVILFEYEDYYFFGYVEFIDDYNLFKLLIDEILKDTDKPVIGPIDENISNGFRIRDAKDSEEMIYDDVRNPHHYHEYFIKYGFEIYQKWTRKIINIHTEESKELLVKGNNYYKHLMENGIIFERLNIQVFNKYYKQIKDIYLKIEQEHELAQFNEITNTKFIKTELSFLFNKYSYLAIKNEKIIGAIFIKTKLDYISLKRQYVIEKLYDENLNNDVDKALLYLALENIRVEQVSYIEKKGQLPVISLPKSVTDHYANYYLYKIEK